MPDYENPIITNIAYYVSVPWLDFSQRLNYNFDFIMFRIKLKADKNVNLG